MLPNISDPLRKDRNTSPCGVRQRALWGMGGGILLQLSMPAVGASLRELKTQAPCLNDHLVHGVDSQISKAYLSKVSHSQF